MGETLAHAAQRELWEEARVRGRATRLLGIWDSRLNGSRIKAHMYHALFAVEAGDAVPQAGPETTGVGYFAEDELPELHPGHQIMVPSAFKLDRGDLPVPYFDTGGPAQSQESDLITI